MDLLLLLIKTGIVMGMLYALFAYGLSLILSVNKVFHVAQGATFILSAFIFYTLVMTVQVPMILAVLLTLVAAGLIGALMQLVIYQPLARRGANPMVILVASLLLVTFGQYLIELIWGPGVRSTTAPSWMIWSTNVFGLRIDAWDLSVLVVGLLVFTGMHWFLTRTHPGLEFRAVGDNPARAEALAINLNRVFMRSMVLGSMLVVPAAVLLTLRAPIHSHMGFDLLLKAVLALTIGGMGSMSGALVGGLLVGLVEALPPLWLPTEWGEFSLFIVAFLFVLIRPRGLLGGRRRGGRRKPEKKPPTTPASSATGELPVSANGPTRTGSPS